MQFGILLHPITMKKQSSITLSISQPCHESWSEMTPADKGRFCLNCQKTVTDFTQLSNTELIELLQSKQVNTCGRFLPHQLNRTLSIPVREKHRKPFLSMAAIAAAMTITIPFAKAANSPEKTQYSIDNEDKQTIATYPQHDTVRFITGVISDKHGTPLPGVTIIIKNQHLVGAQTDYSGKFSMRVPDNFKKKVMTLEVRYLGYMKKTIKIVLKDFKPLDISLTEDNIVLGQYSIHFDTDNEQRISLWTRFRDTVKTFSVDNTR
jgi:hypothetical protein